MSDAELFLRWRAGDTGALEPLIRRHFAAVRALALAITGDPDEADDVCQDVFVLCWKRRRQCRRPERFGSWLMAIARSTAVTRVRRRRRRVEVNEAGGKVDQSMTPVRDAEREELRRVLSQGVKTLTKSQGVVLLLRDLEGWPHGEIAKHLGISETMSRRHLSDARKRMRSYLTHKGMTDE